MRNMKVLDLTIMSMFLTIIMVMSAVPNLGYITLPFFPAVGGTLIHIPVLVATIYFGMRIGIVAGVFFGVSSWAVALYRAALPLEFIFRNPLVSVLPRVLFAVFAVLIYRELSKRIKNDVVSITLTAVISTVIHTLLVLPMLVAFGTGALAKIYGEASVDIIFDFILYVLTFNTILEAILAGLFVSPIVLALKAAFNNQPKNDDVLIIED